MEEFDQPDQVVEDADDSEESDLIEELGEE